MLFLQVFYILLIFFKFLCLSKLFVLFTLTLVFNFISHRKVLRLHLHLQLKELLNQRRFPFLVLKWL